MNIIPSEVCMETYVRAKSADAMIDASHKVDRALRGAAMALGCQVEIETVPGNLPLRNDPGLTDVFRDVAGKILGEDSYRDYPHMGGSTDAGDLSQIMPVLHPMMTGAAGSHHQTDWCIADHQTGYVAPAKTLALMAFDLLKDNAAGARQILDNHTPAMTQAEYLQHQTSVFKTERFDGAKMP